MTHSAFYRILLITLFGLLLIPLVGMQISDGWNWTLFDFTFAAFMIAGVQCTYEFLSQKFKDNLYRLGVGIALVTTFLLVWINGAVGIIGSENNDVNMLYGVVVAIIILGSIIVRFKSQGMAWVLFTAAFAQMLVPICALMINKPDVLEAPGVAGVFALNTGFVILFAGSGFLFKRSSEIHS